MIEAPARAAMLAALAGGRALPAGARPAPIRSLSQHRAACALFEARRCYDHLAGRRGV